MNPAHTYRIRNHPSLALHTGGNENNPYALENDAVMWVIARETEDLDPSRKFWRTTADKGTAHIYLDMEPVWYRKLYNELPMVGESGIHCFPNAKSLRQQISEAEYDMPLDNIFSESFRTEHPQLVNHFTEFKPDRIPRMLSRASAIQNVRGISLPDLCEATQMASYEFYQFMIQAMRENYPVSGGIMPWVFKRPWTTVAVQTVDGLGESTAPYYAVKNAHAPVMAELALREVTYAPGETVSPELVLLCDDNRADTGLKVCFELYSPGLECVLQHRYVCDIDADAYSRRFRVPEFVLPDAWTEACFLQRVAVYDANGLIHQSIYWCRILEKFRNREVLEAFRAKETPNAFYEDGPWLKPQLQNLCGTMDLVLLDRKSSVVCGETRLEVRVRISNTGTIPLFPVKFEVPEDRTLLLAQDNDFFLEPGTAKDLTMQIRVRDPALRKLTMTAAAWECSEAVTTDVAL